MSSKYQKTINGAKIDVYDVLKGFEVINPAIQHAIKKLLAGGKRGYKDEVQDYEEAIASIKRGIELIKYDEEKTQNELDRLLLALNNFDYDVKSVKIKEGNIFVIEFSTKNLDSLLNKSFQNFEKVQFFGYTSYAKRIDYNGNNYFYEVVMCKPNDKAWLKQL